MKVDLLRYTPDVEKLIASAAKLCYSPVGVDEIEDNLDDASVKRFIDSLMKLEHQSPIEHATFTFGIEGVSRVLTHQLVRHRLASYSQQSQRYVKLDQFEYIIPPYVSEDPIAKDIFIEHMKDSQRAYDGIVYRLTEYHYNRLIQEGKSQKEAEQKAEKQAIEDARYVFPNACETKIVATMNARSLFNFFELRCCERAQWEIRELANQMLDLVREVAPTLFSYTGAPCENGPCPEGKMSCGHPKSNNTRS